MIKLQIIKCIGILNVLGLLKERQNPKTGEVIKGVTIPANKATTGYWLGRLEDKLTSIHKQFNAQNEKLIKQFGTPIMTKKADPKDASKQIEVESGNHEVKWDSDEFPKYKEAIEALQQTEEEIDINQFEISMFEGIDFPQAFWAAMTPLIKDPTAK